VTDFTPALFAGRSGKERNPLRILLWLVLAGVLAFLFSIPAALLLVVGPLDPATFAQVAEGQPLAEGPQRLRHEAFFMTLLAVSLAGAAFGALVAGRTAFGRPMTSFLTPAAPFRWSLLALGALILAVLVGAAIALDPLITGEPLDPPLLDPDYAAGDRLLYAGAALFMLLIAAASEEVIFRGVVLQVTGAFTRNVLLLCLINGVLFSAIHLDFDPASFIARVALGAAFTWTVLKLGGLEFAIGAHAANNIMIALFGGTLSEAADVSQTPGPIYAVLDVALGLGMILAVLAIARSEAGRRWIGRPAGAGL
jgi:hypothetical protein